MIDAEPTGFFIPRNRPDPWLGFERGVDIMNDFRRMLSQRTGRPVRFTWLVRADPQIEIVYGRAAWAFERYRRQLEDLEAAGDEIGLHVHAYRWNDRINNWIEDYGDQPWVEHCVHTAFRAFEMGLGRRPASFSMGVDWINQATVQMMRELDIRWELTPIPGTESRPLDFRTGPYTGVAPDCTGIPRHPYQPSGDDFRRPSPHSDHELWIFPLSSRIAPLELSLKRQLYERLLFKPTVLRWRKFFLTDRPTSMRPAIEAAMHTQSHLTFSVRTDAFGKRRSVVAMRKNLEHLLAQKGADPTFATPAETLRILRSNVARQPVACV